MLETDLRNPLERRRWNENVCRMLRLVALAVEHVLLLLMLDSLIISPFRSQKQSLDQIIMKLFS